MLHHDPVLFNEVQEYYRESQKKNLVIDATLGLGGHAQMLIGWLPSESSFIGFDRDQANLELARSNITAWSGAHVYLEHASFAELSITLDRLWFSEIDFILYDLWVSSAHYDEASRGFSIRFDGPLDMRFDRTRGKTAQDLIETLDEKELMRIMYVYADEKKAPFIARAIVEERAKKPIQTTFELRDLIEKASFDPKSAPRVFQAFRIAVNDEFGHVERSLGQAIDRLSLGGRIAVITFHSIEDRLVKNIFAPHLVGVQDEITGQIKIPPKLKKVTKKPIEPTEQEIQKNPRSRSAKLRIVERIS
jgi:16S rRNA (cytosine1402-N4)-methyltransferase